MDIPDAFYRVSAKALILNDKKEFLLAKEKNGYWDLPGGGLDWNETPEECLTREIKEEMGLTVTHVAKYPSYFQTSILTLHDNAPMAQVIYEVMVTDLNFTPSDECSEIGFYTKGTLNTINPFKSVENFANMFDPNKHTI